VTTIGATQLSSSTARYLLFAGQHDTRGGLRDLKGVFEDEAVARAAFAALRLSATPSSAWGELGYVDGQGTCKLLCWFGDERPVRRRNQSPGAAHTIDGTVGAPRASFWHRGRSRRSPRRRRTA
jgi:hypothetical protein